MPQYLFKPKCIILLIKFSLFLYSSIYALDPELLKENKMISPKKNEPYPIQVSARKEKDSASEGIISSKQISFKPLYSTGEIAEHIPGVISTGHSGGGKANQYFLRGFSLDHGTDFATSIDGVVVNNPSHAHGQGYNDLNFLIPELIQEIKYKKGVYSVENGNFSSAGSMNIIYFRSLEKGTAKIEVGNFGHRRALVMDSVKIGKGNLIYAGEVSHYDGPWTIPDNYKKLNSVLGFNYGDDTKGYSIKLSGYSGKWHATNQIPMRAIERGRSWLFPNNNGLNRFDAGDTTDGGKSNRVSLTAEAYQKSRNSSSKILFYNVYYDLDLYSNFTFYLKNPITGDQIQQKEFRTISGINSSHSIFSNAFGLNIITTFGLQIRRDYIQNQLNSTEERKKRESIKDNRIHEINISPYIENQIYWSEKIKTVLGVRGEYFYFNVEDKQQIDQMNDTKKQEILDNFYEYKRNIKSNSKLLNPKGSLIIGPFYKTEIYINAGFGFHSNDARGLLDPNSKVTPLSRTKGEEIGFHTNYLKNLSSTIIFWRLYLESELVFSGDEGTTEPTRESIRKGFEFNNTYLFSQNFFMNADLAVSRAKYLRYESSGDSVPLSARSIFSSGINYSKDKYIGTLNVRYFGPRPLLEDDSLYTSPATTINLMFSRIFFENWNLRVEVFNLLNSKIDRIQYYYPTRLKYEPLGFDEGGYNDKVVSPFAGRNFRFSLSTYF